MERAVAARAQPDDATDNVSKSPKAFGYAVLWTAIGGGAVGYYAFGGGAFGKFVISAVQRSPEAVEFFKHWLPVLPIR